jgi:hypothetical protein
VSDTDTPASIITLRTRNFDGGTYKGREINKEFEDELLGLFKIVPPCPGFLLYIETRYKIDTVAYHKGKIILCLTLEF